MASIEEYLAGLDPLDTPDADFRAEVRERFLDPTTLVAAPAAHEASVRDAAERRRATAAPTRAQRPSRERRPGQRVAADSSGSSGLRLLPRVLVGAAAAVLFAFVLRGLDGGDDPSWTVARLRGEGPVRVDGREVALSEVGALLGAARKIETGSNGLRLTWPGEFVIDLAPETDFRADTFRPTEEALPVFDLVAGEILVRTSDRYTSGQLVFHTPEVDVRITGTTLGIEAMPGYTCVCVCEGEVQVGEPSGTDHSVVTGRSLIRTSEGKVQSFGFDQVSAAHGQPLRDLYELSPTTLFP